MNVAKRPVAETSPIATTLGSYVAAAAKLPLPAAVEAKTRQHLIDTVAAMVSGSALRPGQLAIRFAGAQGGTRQATVAGSRVVTTAASAAMTNGMLAHADETDDLHGRGRFHPGCGIVPAALAVAEWQGRDGSDLLRAIALGYDIGCRFNLALGFSKAYETAHSMHSLGGLFGASAAAAALLGFDSRQVRHLFSYAAQQASGLACWTRDEEHVGKAFVFGGMAGRNAVTAAAMVAAGFTGIDDVFAGAHNVISAFAVTPRPEELVEGLGERFEILDASLKKWCVGSPIQAALDSLEALMQQQGVMAGDVEQLTVRLPDDRAHIVDDRTMPGVCVQHLLAVMLRDGGLSFASAHDATRMSDPAIRELRQRILLVPDSKLTRARPERQAIVEIATRDGRNLQHRTTAVRGTPDNPMTDAEVEAKARDLMAPVLGAARSDALIAELWKIERMDSLRSIRPRLQA